jgi:lysophospholipase L1-like esterase
VNLVRTAMGAVAIACLAPAAFAAAPAPQPAWIGTWGYVTAPLPPGAAPAAAVPAPPSTEVPLGALAPPRPAPAPINFPAPLIENPGAVPVVNAATDLANVTVRQLVRVSAGGQRLRLRISNEAGADALTLGAVHVGEAGPDGQVIAGTDRVVTFDGRGGVTAPASSPVLSDPIDLPTKALDRLYISIYVPGQIARGSQRALFQYVSGAPGDQTGAAQLPNQRLMRVQAFVPLVETQVTGPANVVVTLGDSITEGATSTSNAFRSWPDRLAERLAGSGWGVVNAGISGNRLLRYGAGPTALARLDRDVLSVPGVKTIVVMEAINDIGRGFAPTGAREAASLESLEAADKQIIARAHEHGIRVIGATLTPYGGASYASADGEAVRTALNTWIKTGGAFDGYIDFAPAVASKSDPLTFDPQYNIRDHLHPNDAGYHAMGDAIDLAVITGEAPKKR